MSTTSQINEIVIYLEYRDGDISVEYLPGSRWGAFEQIREIDIDDVPQVGDGFDFEGSVGIDVLEAERAVRLYGYAGAFRGVLVEDFLGTVCYRFNLAQVWGVAGGFLRVNAGTGVVM